jgi:hypothetical protein
MVFGSDMLVASGLEIDDTPINGGCACFQGKAPSFYSCGCFPAAGLPPISPSVVQNKNGTTKGSRDRGSRRLGISRAIICTARQCYPRNDSRYRWGQRVAFLPGGCAAFWRVRSVVSVS